MIVIAPNRSRGVLLNPVNARSGIRSVLDEVAETETRIERFANRGQSGPVRVDVGQQEDFHRPAA
jgi:hypothetical protein